MHLHLTNKYGIQIPRTTKIGYGFYIGHGIGIVINGGTIIGNNVNVSQFLSIGTNKHTPAIIGDNVYIGPSVCIVEDVHVGNNSCIAAGAVVTKDVPENTIVAGCPAKVIGKNKHPEYVHNRCNL
jgi:serine O-acetyltransferase